jgi:Leucine-rich repeat (LRR) protein
MTPSASPFPAPIDDYLDSLPLHIQRIELTFLKTLTRIPSLKRFTHLKDLDLSNNQLVELPELPDCLQALWCYNNCLTHLPGLPESLSHLYAHDNEIETVTRFPHHLQFLSLHHNQLQSLPTLPETLVSLHCENNRMERLPPLPANLRHLYCFDNPLKELPTPLPTQLRHLYCQRTHLTSVPWLPSDLLKLNISNSPVTRICNLPPPLQRPSSLQHTPIYDEILQGQPWEEITQRLQILNRFRWCYFLLRFQDKFRRWCSLLRDVSQRHPSTKKQKMS